MLKKLLVISSLCLASSFGISSYANDASQPVQGQMGATSSPSQEITKYEQLIQQDKENIKASVKKLQEDKESLKHHRQALQEQKKLLRAEHKKTLQQAKQNRDNAAPGFSNPTPPATQTGPTPRD